MLFLPHVLTHRRHDADAAQNVIGHERQRRNGPVGHERVRVGHFQVENALRPEDGVGAYSEHQCGRHQHRDQRGKRVDHAVHAQQGHQKHDRHEHGAAQPGGHGKHLHQQRAHTRRHQQHHKEQKRSADTAGGCPQPFDVPGHHQLVHVGTLGHLRQADKQDADDGE